MDLGSRLRAVVRPAAGAAAAPRRELTYEPDDGRGYERTLDLDRVADVLGGCVLTTEYGRVLAVDRHYAADRQHGSLQLADCEVDWSALPVLDLAAAGRSPEQALFLDLETTGLSGGAGTVAFLIGCGWFDAGGFHVRQFLLTSHSAERALLAAAAAAFEAADLLVTYNGRSFDVPVMETRWAFHRLPGALDGTPHLDMLHPARRLWKDRAETGSDAGGCRLTSLERLLLGLRRVGDVDGFEIPGRFFQFLRTGDAHPLEPVLEHNRLDLVSLAAVTAVAARLVSAGESACRDAIEALALGRVFERAGEVARAAACYHRAASAECVETCAEALYRLGLGARRRGEYEEAAGWWRQLVALTAPPARRRDRVLNSLREFALEALAVHHEHRVRDLHAARELAMFALEETTRPAAAEGIRHRISRLERKLARKQNAQLSF